MDILNTINWGVYFELVERIKLAFDEEAISFLYPPRTAVHL